MVAIGHQVMGPLLAAALGVVFWGGISSAQAPGTSRAQEMHHEIVVTAARNADAALTVKVETALKEDPYIFSDHVTITTEKGVVHLRGVVTDIDDLFAILSMARKIAGSRRVVDEIEFAPVDFDSD